MSRKEELIKICDGASDDLKSIILPMIDDIVFLEDTLYALRKLPFIKIHPTDKTLQKPTPASKQYKELLQQYSNCIKILCGVLGKNDGDGSSALREGLNKLYEKYQ